MVLMAPGFLSGPSFDAAVFTAVAERLRAGDLPYVDAWDHKPPLIYVVNAAVQWASSWWLGPWLPIWAISAVIAGAAAAVIAAVLHEIGIRGRWAVLGGMVAAALMSLYVVSLGGGLSEPMATLALALVLRSVCDAQHPRAFIGGVLAGLATLASFLAGPGVAALGLYVLLRHGWHAVGRYTGGAVAVLMVAVTVGYAAGALPAAYDALVTYGGAYRAANLAWEGNYMHAEAAVIALALAWVAIPAAVGVLRWLGRRGDAHQRHLGWTFLVWMTLTVVIPVYLGRFETHYVAPLAIPLSVLATAGAADVVRRRRRSRVAFALIATAWLVTLGISTTISVLNTMQLGAAVDAETRRTHLVANYVAEHSSPGERIWVWGNEPQLYYLAAREPASRFLYLLPLTTPGYATPALIREVLAEWSPNPPEIIIDAGSFAPGTPGDPPLLIERPVVGDGRSLDILQPLRSFVASRYDLLATVDGWPVYRLAATE